MFAATFKNIAGRKGESNLINYIFKNHNDQTKTEDNAISTEDTL